MKRREIRRYASAGSIRVLIETGTYQGETIEALRHHFHHLYSIELSDEHYRRARERFAPFSHISVLHGDSSDVLAEILTIPEPCLFWLDAHHSGGDTAKGQQDTPIVQELQVIFQRRGIDDVVLIDDASDFIGKNDYPTLDELRAVVRRERPDWIFAVRDNMIRAHSPGLDL